MSRYYLNGLRIEGFRGINNAGDPLVIRFEPNAVNSIHAPNGVGKTSIFEAVYFAIFNEVPRLTSLQAAEHPEEYVNNRFHAGAAVIGMTFAADDGSADVEITVERTATGLRTARSATGHTDPEGFLRSLREDFVLIDYRKFARFIDDTALVRGRSFASLVGLSRYSALRRSLEGAKNTQSLNTDFDIRAIETRVANSEQRASEAAQQALTAYTEITSQTAADLRDVAGMSAAVTTALQGIEILRVGLGTADILTADLAAMDAAVEAAEGGLARQQLATLIAEISTLRELAPGPEEKTERDNLLRTAVDRDAAILTIGTPRLRELYQTAAAVLAEPTWPDDSICPVCDSMVDQPLSAHMAEKLAAYRQADELNEHLATAVVAAHAIGRLALLETNSRLAVTAPERRHAAINTAAGNGTLTTTSLREALAALDALEERRQLSLKEAEVQQAALERQLPPSLVAVTRILGAARRFRDAITHFTASIAELNTTRRQLQVRRRWQEFIGHVADGFSAAEAALAEQRIGEIEEHYQDFFEDLVRGGPNVQPTLARVQDTEQVELLLSDFHGLTNINARAVLSESYRNAVAASIFLTAAVKHHGIPRFMILDDITSSFDAGHQFSLMEGIRRKLQQPANTDGLQFIILSHDVALEKYFDTLNATPDWRHQKLQGMPPVGRVMISAQEADRLKAVALGHLQAGQIDIGAPLVRQYLEYKLGQIISRLQVPVPPDYANRGDRRTLSTYLSAITNAVNLYQRAGICVLSPQQILDLTTRHGPTIMANFVSHYETSAGTPFNAYVLIGVLQTIEDFANCFTYLDTAQTPPVPKFYRHLDQQ